MNPLISVIIPVYKVEQFLPRCVDSIINQSYKNLEIILIDDGSPDNCGKICDEYAEKDPRIKVIHQENAGVSAARNAGLDSATGDFLMFVDSDDYLALDAVEALYERLQQDGSDMAVGKHTDVYDDGTQNGNYCEWMKDAVYTKEQVFEQFGQEHYLPVSTWGKLYSRELFDGVKYSQFAYGEDMLLFFEVLEKCTKISVVERVIYFYYQRSNSVTHVYNSQRQRDLVETNLYVARLLWDKGLYKSAANWFNRCILFAYWTKETEVARLLLRKYFNTLETLKLLSQQPTKSKMQWIAVYIPVFRKIGTLLRKMGFRK